MKFNILFVDGSRISGELYKEVAPKTVENFVNLARNGFYNGTIFHRIIDGFMIQGGGYFLSENTLFEKKADPIDGEFIENGFMNGFKHGLGVLSMARTSDPNSASSQFFICLARDEFLDGKYATFGRVTDFESLETLLRIGRIKTRSAGSMSDFPVDIPVIHDITISEE